MDTRGYGDSLRRACAKSKAGRTALSPWLDDTPIRPTCHRRILREHTPGLRCAVSVIMVVIMMVVGVYVRAPRPDGKCCGERGCGRSCGRSRGHEPWGRDRVDIRNNGWRLHHYRRCGWERRGHAHAFCGQCGVDAFSTPSTDELDGMFDDAGLEERCDVLLDGFDAPGKRADERVLDRSRDRP